MVGRQRNRSDHGEQHRQGARIVAVKNLAGVRILFLCYRERGMMMYALGVVYGSGNTTPDMYAGTSDVIATFRAYLLLINFLTKDSGPIRRRTVHEYAEDCRGIVDLSRSKRLDASRDTSAAVSAIRDQLGLEMFLLLRDFPVDQMPQAILKMANRGSTD